MVTSENTQQPTDIASLSFEAAVGELEAIVKRLETEEGELDHAIGDYERGMALKAHCEKKLAEAKMKVEKVVQKAGGELGSEAFNPQGE